MGGDRVGAGTRQVGGGVGTRSGPRSGWVRGRSQEAGIMALRGRDYEGRTLGPKGRGQR